MNNSRYVVLGLARPRATWFVEVSRWANAGSAPLDFVKCVSAEEVRARLSTGRAFSAVLIDANHPGLDRDLVDVAREAGATTILVGSRGSRDAAHLGAANVLAENFSRSDLLAALTEGSTSIEETSPAAALLEDLVVTPPTTNAWHGQLIAVTGPGGSGRSTIAMGLAQTLADDARNNGKVVLADLCLRSGQAMLHDSPDVIPSISELVEGFRSGTPDASAVRATTFEIAARGYDLLLGLRRRRDWGALRPRAVTATLQGLLGAYRFVVADVEDDLEGELQGGSVEVEERNVLARTALGAADVVVVVARSDMAGLHSLLQTLAELDDFGVPADRVLPVCNGAPHTPSGRARLARAFAELARGTFSHQLATPIFIPHFRRVETAVADVSRLPAGLGSALCRAAIALAENSRDEASKEPEPLSPGSLGLLSEQVPSQ